MLTPEYVLQIFNKIPTQDLPKLGAIIRSNHPRALIMTSFPVPPCCIRPSVRSSVDPKKSNEDEITMSLSQMIFANIQLKDNLEIGREKFLFTWL